MAWVQEEALRFVPKMRLQTYETRAFGVGGVLVLLMLLVVGGVGGWRVVMLLLPGDTGRSCSGVSCTKAEVREMARKIRSKNTVLCMMMMEHSN